MGRRRGFGELERRVSAKSEVTYRARYAMPDGTRYSRTLGTKMDAEAWLATERSLIDRDVWSPPAARKAAEERRQREASYNTVKTFGERYLKERGLRPNTVRNYERLLAARINPYFGEMPLRSVTLSEIKAWRASLDPKTGASNAAAYRLLRSLLQAAEEDELIDRAPPKIRGASSATVSRVAVPATFDEIAVIADAMPERLKVLIVLAAFVGLRQGELLELRRSDVDGVTGRINVSRKSTRTSFPAPPAPARSAARRSARRRPRAAPAPFTSRRRSCRCCRSTCSSTPRPAPPACSSPATAPTT
jgi:integrase